MKRLVASIALLLAASAEAQAPPEARALWSISSDDCVSVNADGPSWNECGFQAFDMNAEGTRVLTVSSGGTVQLWDAEGRELRKIEWGDQPGGASGWPDGRAVIVGNLGLAIVHYNQLLVLDLSDGRTLTQRVVNLMTINDPRRVGERVLVETNDRQWRYGAHEILLPSAEIRPLGDQGLGRVGPTYWVSGSRAPFTLHRVAPDPAEIPLERSCMPVDARYCQWRDIPGRDFHVFDVPVGRWHSFDMGGVLDEYTFVDLVPLAGRLFATVCGRAPHHSRPRPCSIRDLAAGTDVYRFEADNQKTLPGVDEQGRPEFRLALRFSWPQRAEDRRVSLDGVARIIDSGGRANLAPPGGGLVIPAIAGDASMLLDAAGRPVALLPFRAQTCGNGWPTWTEFCRFSADGRRWLVPATRTSRGEPGDDDTQQLGLTLLELPSPAVTSR